MVTMVMDRFGTKKKNYIDFIEFCGVMEYLWSLKALNEFYKCKEKIAEYLEVIYKVYNFIDSNKNGVVNSQELNEGLDKFMNYKVPPENYAEVLKLFAF